ncbi:MAG TPA: hypothetical protein VLB86_00630 [Gaiellaceae bacterium]|nr:hypothetical protein [Gaiellaceae bacterium]
MPRQLAAGDEQLREVGVAGRERGGRRDHTGRAVAPLNADSLGIGLAVDRRPVGEIACSERLCLEDFRRSLLQLGEPPCSEQIGPAGERAHVADEPVPRAEQPVDAPVEVLSPDGAVPQVPDGVGARAPRVVAAGTASAASIVPGAPHSHSFVGFVLLARTTSTSRSEPRIRRKPASPSMALG